MFRCVSLGDSVAIVLRPSVFDGKPRSFARPDTLQPRRAEAPLIQGDSNTRPAVARQVVSFVCGGARRQCLMHRCADAEAEASRVLLQPAQSSKTQPCGSNRVPVYRMPIPLHTSFKSASLNSNWLCSGSWNCGPREFDATAVLRRGKQDMPYRQGLQSSTGHYLS